MESLQLVTKNGTYEKHIINRGNIDMLRGIIEVEH